MSVIKINVSTVIGSGSLADSAKTVVSSQRSRIRSVGRQIDGRIRGTNGISSRLDRVYSDLRQAESRIGNLKNVVEKCAIEYKKADMQIKKLADSTADFPNPSGSKKDSIFKKILKDQWSIKGSVASGSIVKSGSILGIGVSGKAEGDLIGGSVKTKSEAKFNLDKKDVQIEKSIEAEGHLAHGELSGNVGWLNGKIGGTVGLVSATGKIGTTLFKDGKFSPTIDAEAKAEASAVKGDFETSFGSEKNNAHINGSGSLLNASAKASGSVGVIKTVDEVTNTTKTEFGVKGSVGAEAYLAQGKISGGFTIWGVKINAGLSGKAGGAGVEADGKITTGGVSGKIGAGLGLGAGVEISIDWSGLFS